MGGSKVGHLPRHEVECTIGKDCKKWRPNSACMHEGGPLRIGPQTVDKAATCLEFEQDYEYRREQLKENLRVRNVERSK